MRVAQSLLQTALPSPRGETSAWTARAGAGIVRALAASWRIARCGDRGAGPRIYVFPHASAAIAAGAHVGCDVTVLVSLHAKSDVFAAIAAALGYDVVRGSSSRGGADAVFALARALRGGRSVAITPDGPRGPVDGVAPGVGDLAGRTGVPIVPVGCAAAPAWRVPSWDRLLVPIAGARVAIAYGAPLSVSRRADACARDRLLRETAGRMVDARATAEALVG